LGNEGGKFGVPGVGGGEDCGGELRGERVGAESGGAGGLREGVGLVGELEHGCSGVSWRLPGKSKV